MVRPDTYNSNNGNFARTFCKNWSIVEEILNVETSLVKIFGSYLQVLASGHEVNINYTNKYCY